jgi:hypothetical protein
MRTLAIDPTLSGERIVEPVPDIVPPLQLKAPEALKVPPPFSVPLLKVRPETPAVQPVSTEREPPARVRVPAGIVKL